MAKTSDEGAGAKVSGVPLLLLMSLATGPKHGHALMKDVEGFAGVRLGPGSLYKALGRLEEDRLAEALEHEERRRPYAITDQGRTVLADSLDYLGQVVDEGRARLRRPARRAKPSPAGAR